MFKKIIISENVLPFFRCLPSFTKIDSEEGVIGTYDGIDVELSNMDNVSLKETSYNDVCDSINGFNLLENLRTDMNEYDNPFLTLLEGDNYYIDIDEKILIKLILGE